MPLPDLPGLLGQVRALTARYRAGQVPDSFEAFRELVHLLLSNTVLDSSGGVRLFLGPRRDTTLRVLGGWSGPDDPLPLNDGRFLRLTMTLYLEGTDDGPRVKVRSSSFQYQADRNGDRWICRYDYIRQPPEPHPSTHLHINGSLAEPSCLPAGRSLESVHFPTDRVAIEAVIRLLIEQFDVSSNVASEIWRPLLAESEAAFKQIAHRSISGPSR